MSNKTCLSSTAFVFLTLLTISLVAHPGGMDSKGGHRCSRDCSRYGLKTGEYHLHGNKTSDKRSHEENKEEKNPHEMMEPLDPEQAEKLRSRLEKLRQQDASPSLSALPSGDGVLRLKSEAGREFRVVQVEGRWVWLQEDEKRLLYWRARGRDYLLEPLSGDMMILWKTEDGLHFELRLEENRQGHVFRGKAEWESLKKR